MNQNSFDPSNMFEAIYQFPEHLEEAMDIGKNITLKNQYSDIQNIVVAGMGGSAIGGDVVGLLTKNDLKIPMLVSRHYNLPHWVNKNTLVISSSYSGNTEESLSAYGQAREKGALTIGLSTGGTLTDLMTEADLDVVTIPGGLQPRAALAFSFVPMIFLLYKLELIGDGFLQELRDTIETLKHARDNYAVEGDNNAPYALAKNIYSTLPILYGGTDSTGVIANRWKGQLSENAKMLAYFNELPELDHNEIVGWENNPDLLKKISLIWLGDRGDHPSVKIRQTTTRDIIADLAGNHFTVQVDGDSESERYLHLIHYGDWVSYWCAFLHKTDPTPVKKIDRLKGILAKEV